MNEDLNVNKIDALFSKWDNKGSPGCAIGIIKEGRFLYKKGYGMANLDYDIPITPSTAFYIASTSKQFTAFCIALLKHQGKLSYDDNVRKYIPELPEYKKPITIRHLIHHISGIRDFYSLLGLKGLEYPHFRTLTYGAVLKLLSRQKKLNFLPGNEYLYSNSGYLLMSMIIKQISGMSIGKFAKKNIFDPLGMNNTQYHEDHTQIIPNRAIGYTKPLEGSIKISNYILDISGGGGVITNIEDFLHWDNNFYNPVVGNRELIQEVITPGLLNNGKPIMNDNQEYAFGLNVGKYRGFKTISHGGAFSGFRTHMLRFPEIKYTIICFSNLAEFMPREIVAKIADIYLEDKFPIKMSKEMKDKQLKLKSIPEVKLTEDTLRNFIGFYKGEKLPVIVKTRFEDNYLHFDVNNNMFNFIIAPIAENRFKTVDGPFFFQLEFLPSNENETHDVKAYLPEPFGEQLFKGLKNITYTEEELYQYLGTYYSEDLDCHYYLTSEESKLNLRIEENEKQELFSSQKDLFWLADKGVSLTFQRNKNRIIKVIIVDNDRAKAIQFVKQ